MCLVCPSIWKTPTQTPIFFSFPSGAALLAQPSSRDEQGSSPAPCSQEQLGDVRHRSVTPAAEYPGGCRCVAVLTAGHCSWSPYREEVYRAEPHQRAQCGHPDYCHAEHPPCLNSLLLSINGIWVPTHLGISGKLQREKGSLPCRLVR